jgi:hypothetical protein
MFHNVEDYHTLDYETVLAPPQYCAPRLQEGYEVERARQRLALRAGLLRAADGEHVGTLRGAIDEVSAHRIAGWAQTIEHPDAPVCLDIFADGNPIGCVLANRGIKRHGFEFTSALDLSMHTIEVRRSCDGAALERAGEKTGTVKVYRRAVRA